MRRSPKEFIKDITVEPDGLQMREAQPHSRDKLGILRYYLPAFTQACKERSPAYYFVDGFAGEGRYWFQDDQSSLLGSTLIALEWGHPPFTKCLAMELDSKRAAVLRRRVAAYDDRAIVVDGDCNDDLVGLMERELDDRAPVLVLLDPEGFELDWETVSAVAGFRQGRYKAEMLILVATGSVGRAPGGQRDSAGMPESDAVATSFPPKSAWREIVLQREAGRMEPEGMRDALAADYADGVQQLGYATVISRRIARPGAGQVQDGSSVYHLIFATDHPAGQVIMESAFQRVWTNWPRFIRQKMDSGQKVFEEFFDDP